MSKKIFERFQIQNNASTPKFRQVLDQIMLDISQKKIATGEKLPSINVLSEQLKVSRDTIEKAYNVLKKQKKIISIKGKGYYVAKPNAKETPKVLFLINKLSPYKMAIYNAFVNTLDKKFHTDFHIYHCDDMLFLNLLDFHKYSYDYYVIMPHFKTQEHKHINFTPKALKAINKIPKKKLVVMDNNELKIKGNIIEIYQDFENDIYNTLNAMWKKIMRYGRIILMVPEHVLYPYPIRILLGFQKFCEEKDFDYEIRVGATAGLEFSKGDLFLVIEEIDLIKLLNQIKEVGLRLKTDVGVLSYNDTPLKQLLNVSVISTDFQVMGETAAKMILSKQKGRVKNPFSFIDRGTL